MRFVLLLALVAGSRIAAADSRLIDDDTFAVRPHGPNAVDGGLVAAVPSALPSGLSTGVGVGVTRDCTCPSEPGGAASAGERRLWSLSYGARLAWTTVTEASEVWTVSQSDFRLRVFGAIRHSAGRGTIALRLGTGPTFVREVRTRNQAMREGRTDLDTTALAALPALDVEAMFALHVVGPWLAIVTAGPTIDREAGAMHAGWVAGLAIGWQP